MHVCMQVCFPTALSPFSLPLLFPPDTSCVFLYGLYAVLTLCNVEKLHRVPKQSASETKLTKHIAAALCSRSAGIVATLSCSSEEVAGCILCFGKPSCSFLDKTDPARVRVSFL